MLAMNSARDEQELIDWWLGEHDNRRRWQLTPTQSPGVELKQAFDARRAELKRT
jgi:hypothetical protein